MTKSVVVLFFLTITIFGCTQDWHYETETMMATVEGKSRTTSEEHMIKIRINRFDDPQPQYGPSFVLVTSKKCRDKIRIGETGVAEWTYKNYKEGWNYKGGKITNHIFVYIHECKLTHLK